MPPRDIFVVTVFSQTGNFCFRDALCVPNFVDGFRRRGLRGGGGWFRDRS